MSSISCKCGKEKQSTQKKICDDCRRQKKKEKNRLDAKKYRERHGSEVKRGIYCSRCKGIKEHQERGYCLACERERYKEKSKPDCAICKSVKENPRDAYCHKCKNEKAKAKSLLEGRRLKNAKGRKPTCSLCGAIKEGSYISGSYCGKCKKMVRKLSISEAAKRKEQVRRETWKAIKIGKLIRQPCEVCGSEKVEAHHDDYMKPLDVRWLCRKHHNEHHRNLEQKE